MDCGERSGIMEDGRTFEILNCVHCGLIMGVLVNFRVEPTYVSRDFIDINSADQEILRLENRIEHINREWAKEGAMEEKMLYVMILSELCGAKAAEASEAGAAINRDEINKWNLKSRDYYIQFRTLNLERYRRDRGGNFYPYPYIFKPPEPPGDIGVATNVQLNQPVTEDDFDVELFCRYCGSKLAMDESYCSVCSKKS